MTADDVSAFSGPLDHVTSQEQLYLNGSTCQTYIVRVYGKLHFKKQLKAEYKGMPQYVEAFRKEFEVGYRLNHPALPCYVALGDEDGCPYILEEYIDGDTLTDFLAANPCYFHSRLHADRLIDELLSVFSYLHHHQVLFLDLKPDNVMITSVDRQSTLAVATPTALSERKKRQKHSHPAGTPTTLPNSTASCGNLHLISFSSGACCKNAGFHIYIIR